MDIPRSSPAWSGPRRIAFRLAFAYWVLYSFPFPLGTIPGTESLAVLHQDFWRPFVTWVAANVLHLAQPITVFPNGSGDTTFNYVELFCVFGLAALATILWTLVDRKARSYPRLHDALRVYVRFVVATAMWGYGMQKVIQLQFPPPSPARLLSTYGDSSPMGLLWTFMGASTAYTAFAGASEVLGGFLLFFRRTTMLGAMVVAAVMTNVVALNFCYDVPVKIYSSHLLLMALFLLLPDLPRLSDFLIRNRATTPRNLAPPPLPRRWALVRGAAWLAFVAYVSISNIRGALEARYLYGESAPKSALSGSLQVVEFARNGVVAPPLLTDKSQWRRVGLNRWGGAAVRRMDDTTEIFQVRNDPIAKTLTWTSRNESGTTYVFRYQRTAERDLILEGQVGADNLRIRLRPLPEEESFLMTRGFHWINEFPLNR